MLDLVVNILLSDSGAHALALVSTVAGCHLANLWNEMPMHTCAGRTQNDANELSDRDTRDQIGTHTIRSGHTYQIGIRSGHTRDQIGTHVSDRYQIGTHARGSRTRDRGSSLARIRLRHD
jgi:hypothetical protein